MNKKFASSLLIVGCAVIVASCSGQKQQAPAIPQLTTLTIQPEKADIYATKPATIKGEKDTEIRPKVSGYITELLVDEGSIVRKGQVLFKIDKVTYQEAARAAEATVKASEAQVANSKLTADNKKVLYDKGIISEAEYLAAKYAYEAQMASLAQARALYISAQNDLSFTDVTSPSNGVVGTINFRAGALVSSSTSLPLTVVSDISNVYAYFSMNEKEILEITTKAGDESLAELIKKFPEVTLIMADGSAFPRTGKLETVSGVVNQATGSVTLRAKFDNKDNLLRSGSFATVRIPEVDKDVLMVPQPATYELQDKHFVYVVKPDSTVAATQINILDNNDGKYYIVTSGISAGETIVTEGVNKLREGQKIAPIQGQAAQAGEAAQGAQQK